jgi:signal peptidase
MDKKTKKIITILKIFFAVFVSVIIGFNLYLFNSKVFLKEKLPMPLGYGTAVVVSNSMYPYLEINDLIIVKKTNDYEVGDVIVYDDGNVLVVHRIVEIDENTFVAKGDANNSNDKAYSVNLIKGEVVNIIPKLGVLQEITTNPLIGLPCLAIAFFLFELSFRIDKKEEPKENDELQEEIERLKSEINKEN